MRRHLGLTRSVLDRTRLPDGAMRSVGDRMLRHVGWTRPLLDAAHAPAGGTRSLPGTRRQGHAATRPSPDAPRRAGEPDSVMPVFSSLLLLSLSPCSSF